MRSMYALHTALQSAWHTLNFSSHVASARTHCDNLQDKLSGHTLTYLCTLTSFERRALLLMLFRKLALCISLTMVWG